MTLGIKEWRLTPPSTRELQAPPYAALSSCSKRLYSESFSSSEIRTAETFAKDPSEDPDWFSTSSAISMTGTVVAASEGSVGGATTGSGGGPSKIAKIKLGLHCSGESPPRNLETTILQSRKRTKTTKQPKRVQIDRPHPLWGNFHKHCKTMRTVPKRTAKPHAKAGTNHWPSKLHLNVQTLRGSRHWRGQIQNSSPQQPKDLFLLTAQLQIPLSPQRISPIHLIGQSHLFIMQLNAPIRQKLGPHLGDIEWSHQFQGFFSGLNRCQCKWNRRSWCDHLCT